MKLPRENNFHNFVLIGMAGAGKSTIGPLLAQALHLDYVDTDDLIAANSGSSLQQLLDRLGQAEFKAVEEQTLLSIRLTGHVLATGGSVVYSRPGMEHLRHISAVIWLDVDLEILEARVHNQDSRGLVNPAGMSFAELYHQRQGLYREFADLRVNCSNRSPEQIVEEIVVRLQSWENSI